MHMHRDALRDINTTYVPADLRDAARQAWDDVVEVGEEHGYRNAQATVLAPTGTISFMMDCDTTGIEPDIALVKYKQLAGGGMMKIVNTTVPSALATLGYPEAAGQGHRRAHRHARDHRGRPVPAREGPGGLRLRVHAGEGPARHPLTWATSR